MLSAHCVFWFCISRFGEPTIFIVGLCSFFYKGLEGSWSLVSISILGTNPPWILKNDYIFSLKKYHLYSFIYIRIVKRR